jgi:hypothetical protein
MLKISDHLSLPVDLVTLTQAIIAKKGAGKSYCASVQAEEMLKARQQIVVLDPTGAWFGIRSSADGKSDGFPVHVIGGEHADVPLEDSAGEIVAEAIIENRFSAIIDLNMLRKAQLRRFVTPFLETLYRLNREPLHLFVDEADDIAPQKPFGDEAAMLGALEDVVKRGRRKGIGCTLITQRPADLAKQVLTQCDALMSLRLSHPRDIDAIEEWVNVHADQKQAKEMIDSLPSLPTGTGWFWCPLWDIFKKIGIRERTTFDSSATPKVGEKARTPKRLAEVDKQMLGEKIAASVQRVKENDPKELRRRLVAAELQLKVQAVPEIKEKIVDRPVLKDGQLDRAEKLLGRLADLFAKVGEVQQQVRAVADDISVAIRKATTPQPITAPTRLTPRVPIQRPPRVPLASPARQPNAADSGDFTPNGSQLRVLNAIAWFNSIGVEWPSKSAVGLVAKIKPTGGHFANTVGPLSTNGLIEYATTGDGIALTGSGVEFTTPPKEMPTLKVYHEAIRAVLQKKSGASARMFDAIAASGGVDLTTEALGSAVSIEHDGGHFSNSIGPLGTLGLIERKDGVVYPTELMFPTSLMSTK